METVAENREYFSDRAYKKALEARKLYHIVGSPSVNNFKAIIKGNLIKNCPVTVKDIKVAEKIFGKDISSIKGKTIKRTPKSVTDDIIDIPKQLLNNNQNVVLCMDIVYVQGLPFWQQFPLISISEQFNI